MTPNGQMQLLSCGALRLLSIIERAKCAPTTGKWKISARASGRNSGNHSQLPATERPASAVEHVRTHRPSFLPAVVLLGTVAVALLYIGVTGAAALPLTRPAIAVRQADAQPLHPAEQGCFMDSQFTGGGGAIEIGAFQRDADRLGIDEIMS